MLLFMGLFHFVHAQSGWSECEVRKKTFNLQACRRRAEQFKSKQGPHGQVDEAWFTWAKSAPFPLSELTACALAPQSLDCTRIKNQLLSCVAGTELLFNKAGQLTAGTKLNFDGEVVSADHRWEVEKEEGILLVGQEDARSSKLTVDFPEEVTVHSVIVFEEESEHGENVLTVNSVSIPKNRDDRWAPPFGLNKKSNQIVIHTTGSEVKFNICIKQAGITPQPSTPISPTLGPTTAGSPTPPIGGAGIGFLFNPTEQVKNVGDTFEVQLNVDTKTEKVFGAEAHVKYDETILSLSNIREGDFFPTVLSSNNGGNSSIRGIVSEPADYRTGTGSIAFLTFTALKNGATTVTFYCDPAQYNTSKIIKNDINATNVIDCGANNTLAVQVGENQQISPTQASPEPTRTPTKKPGNSDRAKVIAGIILMMFILLIILLGL